MLNLFKVNKNFILHINQNFISKTSIMQKFSTYTRGLTNFIFIIIERISNIYRNSFVECLGDSYKVIYYIF